MLIHVNDDDARLAKKVLTSRAKTMVKVDELASDIERITGGMVGRDAARKILLSSAPAEYRTPKRVLNYIEKNKVND